MTENEWEENFKKICLLYQKNPKQLEGIGQEYYQNSNGSVSKLGNITYYEFGLIIDYLRENHIKPDYGIIPQYYQLLEIYENAVKPQILHDKQQEQTEIEDCQLCDNTGFVPVFRQIDGLEFVCRCICGKGEKTIKINKNKNNKIISWAYYKNKPGYILLDYVDNTIRMLTRDYLDQQKKNYFSKEQIKKNKKRIKELVGSI